MTPRLSFPAGVSEGKHWLEGNVVLDRHGQLLDVLRVDNVEEIALMRIEPDGLHFLQMVDFPGGAKKFTIRYDRKSKLYWALSNPAPGTTNPASVRNTLALVSSSDLKRWEVRRIVLTHPDSAATPFNMPTGNLTVVTSWRPFALPLMTKKAARREGTTQTI